MFKVAFVENESNNEFYDFANQHFKTDNGIQFINITNMSQDEIDCMGAFQGIMYFNDIRSNKEYTEKLESLIRNQVDPTDLAVFPLTHDSINSKDAAKEMENLNKLYQEAFPNRDLRDNRFISKVSNPHEMQSYLDGIILPMAYEYNTKSDGVRMTADEKLNALVKMVKDATEEKHDYTAGHISRVSTYTEYLAKQLGFSNEKLEEVTLAAKLHDIGKIVVSDDVLAQSRALTFLEKKEMGEHAAQGRAFLESIVDYNSDLSEKITPQIIEAVGNHHKDWDGWHDKNPLKDSSDSIKGDDIGEYGLVIAVADCLDAMTSQRAYNNPKHILDTLRDLYQNSHPHEETYRNDDGTKQVTVVKQQFKTEIAEAAIVMLGKEFASLGIDPLKLVPETPITGSKKTAKTDSELKHFLEQHKSEFEVNQNVEKGAFGKLGFRVDENGYFELVGEHAPKRDPNIRFNDEFSFKKTKYAKQHGIEVNDIDENTLESLKAYVEEKFHLQDLEGKQTIENSSIKNKANTYSLSNQILELTQNDSNVNIDNYKNSLGEISREIDSRNKDNDKIHNEDDSRN